MKNNNIIFLSHPYTENTPSYGNRDMVKISSNSLITSGAPANSSSWVFTNNHIGTHIDAPYHFDPDGLKILDLTPSDWIFNNVAIIDIPVKGAKLIKNSEIDRFPIDSNLDLLLIRTGYENYRKDAKYWDDNPGISPDVATYLRKKFRRLRCIGFDFISITSWKHRKIGMESHRAFLCPPINEKPIMAIEDMSLKNINGKLDWVLVSPILMEDGNGSPVTIFANIK